MVVSRAAERQRSLQVMSAGWGSQRSEHRGHHSRARDLAGGLNPGDCRNGMFGSLMSLNTQKLRSKVTQIHFEIAPLH